MVRTYAVTHPPDLGIAPQVHDDWHQLVHASRGVMQVIAEEDTWVVPPHRGIWIPAGVEYTARMSGRVAVRTLFFDAEFADERAEGFADPDALEDCRAIEVSPLLRELILHACRLNILDAGEPRHVRLAEVILDQLEAIETAPLRLPMPRDERAARAAEMMLAGSAEPLAALARASGASVRTLERLFVRDTAMTAGRWRQRARLVEALRLLAAGTPVSEVALEVGYGSPSAFIASFRAQLGTTPGRYFARPDARTGLG